MMKIFQIPKFVICISLLLTSHFSFLTSLYAEEKVEIEEIIVTATRIEEEIEETTSDVIVIKGEDIEKMNVQFVTDVLRKIPELNLVQNGGTGKLATLLLRGGDSKHTLVMIDGIKVKSTTTGSFDFSSVNVDDIERIEIVKGPQSTLYGSEAMAGVINIITKKGKGKPKVEASFESGSYGTYKPSLTILGGDEKLDYRLTGTYFYTDGISAAKEGTEKDGYKNASISGKFGFRPTERAELELSGRYYYDRSELDFGTETDDPNYVQRGNHLLLLGKAKLYLIDKFDKWEQILAASTVKDILKSRDPDDILGQISSDITTGIDTIDWQHNLYFSDVYTFTGGVEYRKEKGESIAHPTRVLRFDKAIDNKALYLHNKLRFFEETLVLNAGLRHDDHETFGDKTTYRISAMNNIKPVALRIKSSYGTGFRAPTLNELFWPDVGWYKGNPNLRPEETNSYDITIEKEMFQNRISLSLTYFDQRYRNLITGWYPPINIAKAEIKGIETNAVLKLASNVNIKAGYTYLDAEDKATEKRLPRRPEDKLSMGTEFSTKDMSLNADYIFVGERYDDSANTKKLSSYSLVNLSGNYKISKKLTIFGRVNNLFDTDYEEAKGYGAAGFSIFGGIKITAL